MKSFAPALALATTLAAMGVSPAAPPREPDQILLNDGTQLSGLILKNTATEVLFQDAYGERTYPKSEISRIFDEPNTGIEHTAANKPGDLPDWRVIVNDLRTHDAVKKLIEVPAVRVSVGPFANIPYRSFRVNRDAELNIYGDPEDPCAIEIGFYGRRANDDEVREWLRSYLAGFLTTREEIAALYALDWNGETRRVGKLGLEVTPPEAEDAFGAWWISLYHPDRLDDVRLTDAEYAALTRPASEVLDGDGRVTNHGWDLEEIRLAGDRRDGDVILRGFYRDDNGVFRAVGTREKATP